MYWIGSWKNWQTMTLGDELTQQNAQPAVNPRYIIRDARFAFENMQPLEWIIDNVILAGSVSVFYGEPGSKKTYSLLSMAVCVALGKSWLGNEVKPRKVLFIDEESGERRLSNRLGAAIKGEFGDETIPIQFVSLAAFMLDSKEDTEEVQNLIQTAGAGLTIIDSLSAVMNGDENSKKDVQPVFTHLRRIAEKTGSAIIVIHHANKNGGYRGSSAIKSNVEQMIQVTSEEGSTWIQFKSEKIRDGDRANFAAVATWTENKFYLSPAAPKEKSAALSPACQYVKDFLKKNGASLTSAITDNADTCSPSAARAAIYKLVNMGLAYRVDKGAGKKEATFDLIENKEVVL